MRTKKGYKVCIACKLQFKPKGTKQKYCSVKCRVKDSTNVAGRKKFDGKDEKIIVLKLEEAWSIGATDAEAAAHADISPAALCTYLKSNKHVSERKEQLKETLLLKIRSEIISGVNGDKEFALKVGEKLLRDYQPKAIAGGMITINHHEYVLRLIEEVKEEKPKLIKAEVVDENKT